MAPASVANKNYALSYFVGQSIPAPTVDNFIVTSNEGAEVSFAWKQGETQLDTIPTSAGTYTLEVTVEAGEKYVQGVTCFTVEIVSPAIAVLMDGDTTYYTDASQAFADVIDKSATITLLSDCETTDAVFLQNGTFVLDTAEYTLTAIQFILENANVTITGNGTLRSITEISTIEILSGSLVFESSTVESPNGCSLSLNDQSYDELGINVTLQGGHLEDITILGTSTSSVNLEITGGEYRGCFLFQFYPEHKPTVVLSGGTYTGDNGRSYVTGLTFTEMLGYNKVFYELDGTLLELEENAQEIIGAFYVANARATIENYDYALSYVVGNSIPAPTADNFTIASDDGAKVSFLWQQGTTLLDTIPTQAGNYILQVVVDEGEHYAKGSALFAVEILPAKMSVKIGDKTTYYPDAKSAFEAASENNATIELLGYFQTEESLYLHGGEFVINLNGNTLNCADFSIYDATVSIYGDGGRIFGTATATATMLINSATVTIELCTVDHVEFASFNLVDSSGSTSLELKDCVFESTQLLNEQDEYDTTMTVRGGEFSGDFIMNPSTKVALYNTAYSEYRTFFLLLYYFGLRPWELTDVRFEGDFLIALNAKHKVDGEAVYKKIPIPEQAKGKIDFSQTIKYPHRTDVLNRIFKRIIEEEGVTQYSLRHSFATTCQQFVRPDIVDIWMGDSSERLVGRVYTHFSDKFMIEQMANVKFIG